MTGLRTARVNVVPPPVGGWNTKDPISEMNPLYAVEMENYFPNGATVDMRKGTTRFATTTDGSLLGTVFEYVNESGTRYLLAFGADAWDCTSSPGTKISTGGPLFSSELYCVNFRGKVFIKDYTNLGVFSWDGSTWADAAFTGPGGDDVLLWKMATYRNRLYFIEKNAASIWYGGVDSITGALTEFDLTSVFDLGGRIWHIGRISSSIDKSAQNSNFLIISEMGEVLIYSGSYPGGSDWQLIGHYYIPAPLARRGFFAWGSDVVVMTEEGILSILEVISRGPNSETPFLSENIGPSFKGIDESISNALVAQQVCGVYFPKGQMLVCNLVDTDGNNVQFVMNTKTRAWCKYTGLDAWNWCIFKNDLFFTSSTEDCVMQAESGYADIDPTDGSTVLNRTCVLRPAYNYLGAPATVKAFRNCRIIVQESEGLNVTLRADVDYEDVAGTNATTDTTDTSYKLYRKDIGLTGLGVAASIRLDDTVTTKRRSIQAFQVAWEPGGLR